MTAGTGLSPRELVLAGYAVGALPPALHALVGAHLALSAANRPFVIALEEALGRNVTQEAPCAIRAREARLDAIFACRAEPSGRISAEACEPKALLHFLGKPIEALDFKPVLPGIDECHLVTGDETGAKLMRVRAGATIPHHAHDGFEVTLVLRGGMRDATGHFRRGDIAIASEALDHAPVVDDDEDCLCFVVLDAPLRFPETLNRWASVPALLGPRLPRA